MLIVKKSKDCLEPGYIFAPYIPVETTQIVSQYSSKRTERKRKINKILKLGLNIEIDFYPKKSLFSRYSTQLENNYQIFSIKKPTY